MISDDRLLDLIAAYGAHPGAWPEEERVAAEARLAADPQRFEAALADARRLDAAFGRQTVPDAPAGLTDRILTDAPAPRARPGRAGPGARLRDLVFPNGVRWPAGATVAALVMGLVAGVTTAPATADNGYATEEEQAVYAALGYDSFEAYIAEVEG